MSMKILMATITLLLLMMVGVKAGDSTISNYSDTCDYTAGRAMCGDQCIRDQGPLLLRK